VKICRSSEHLVKLSLRLPQWRSLLALGFHELRVLYDENRIVSTRAAMADANWDGTVTTATTAAATTILILIQYLQYSTVLLLYSAVTATTTTTNTVRRQSWRQPRYSVEHWPPRQHHPNNEPQTLHNGGRGVSNLTQASDEGAFAQFDWVLLLLYFCRVAMAASARARLH